MYGHGNPSKALRIQDVLILAMVGLACIQAYVTISSRKKANAPTFDLAIQTEHLNFGEVYAQQEFPWTIPIENVTDRQVRVLRLRGSCSCVNIKPSSFTIPAKGMVNVHLTLDLMQSVGKDHQGITRPFAMTLFAVTEGKEHRPISWKVKGQVTHPVFVTPAPLDFGYLSLLGASSVQLDVLVESPLQIDELTVRWSSPFLAAVAQTRINPTSYRLTVTPSTSLTLGPFDTSLFLDPVVNGDTIPTIRIPVTGKVIEDVYPEPASLLLGSGYEGDVLNGTITLRSVTKTPFTIERVLCDDAHLVTDPQALCEDSAPLQVVNVKTKISAFATQRSVCSIFVRGTANDLYEVSIPVTYYGLSRQRDTIARSVH